MEQLPKVLMSSNSLSTGLLWKFRLLAKSLALITEPNLPNLLQRARIENPDLVLLDLNPLTDSGLELIRQLREEQTVPLIILLSIHNAELVLKVYEAGADDCIVKPIEPAIFLAKINAWLNQSMILPADMLKPLRVGKVYLLPVDRLVSLDNGCLIRLTNMETRLLYVLMSCSGRTVPTDDLVRLVWREKANVGGEILKNLVCRLRRKLEEEPANLKCIQNIASGGYKFDLSTPPKLENIKSQYNSSK
jgi:DNA-binding response OmpR family regulator